MPLPIYRPRWVSPATGATRPISSTGTTLPPLSRGADAVVKIPSDCPLIDPQVIDRVLGHFVANAERFDYVSNLHPPTYPDGNDVEVITMPILEVAWREATTRFEREHTTPFIWARPGRFRLGSVEWESGLDYSKSHRWTIDYLEDYEFIVAVYDELWTVEHPLFSLPQILDFVLRRPEIAAVNARLAGRVWLRDLLHKLQTSPHQRTSA
jgi:spore coat polysaccharide biosynthesis protein SpsF